MVPCHRVIASDMTLGGFEGKTNVDSDNICSKVELLQAEGVVTMRVGSKIKVRHVLPLGKRVVVSWDKDLLARGSDKKYPPILLTTCRALYNKRALFYK